MVKQYRFNFMLDVEDRRLLALLAHHLQRTQGDAIRWLIRQAAAQLPGRADEPLEWPVGDEWGEEPL